MKRPSSLLTNAWRLLELTWQEDKFVTIAYFFAAIAGAGLMYVVYFAYKVMIDNIGLTISGTPTILFTVVITYLFFEYLSRFVTYTFNNYYFDYLIRAKLQNVLTRSFMEKLANLEFAQLETGEVRNLIAKVENTYNQRLPEVLTKLNAVVFNIAALFFSLLIAMHFSPRYFIILALVSLPVYYLRAKYGNVAWSSHTSNAPKANYLWYLRQLFTNSETLAEMKIYGLRNHFLEKTKRLQQELLADYQKPIMMYSILSTLSFLLIPVAIYFSVQHFVEAIPHYHHTIGDFTLFLNAMFTFSGQISSVLVNVGSIYENNLFLHDYFKLMDIENTLTLSQPHISFPQVEPRRIEFRNVTFAYKNSESLSLNNVSFTIERGQDIAIVGHNGAGKSTIIKLLFRFYDPTAGQILIDDTDLRSIPLEHWYRHLGVLFQDYARYFLSLKENIQFGNVEKYAYDEIHDALQRARGEELLHRLPNGFEQRLGRWFEGGVELSGGQWQKVAIARAIYRNAPILVLDEPTSAIDADAEAEIFRQLKEVYQHKNLVFISHRFSTVRNANKIIVLEKGTVVESGSHEELLANEGLYSQFFALQRKGYE